MNNLRYRQGREFEPELTSSERETGKLTRLEQKMFSKAFWEDFMATVIEPRLNINYKTVSDVLRGDFEAAFYFVDYYCDGKFDGIVSSLNLLKVAVGNLIAFSKHDVDLARAILARKEIWSKRIKPDGKLFFAAQKTVDIMESREKKRIGL